jgi:hypothetical protein
MEAPQWRSVLLMSIVSGGLLGLLVGAVFGLLADGCGGAIIFGGYGFGVGFIVGCTVGGVWYSLLWLLGSRGAAGLESDYGDPPPSPPTP